MAILQTIYPSPEQVKDVPLWWHKRGLMQTRSGYGRKLTTTKMVWFGGRWRRVYCCIHSNSGTCYITAKGGNWIVVEL